jgi:hypothetical protein
METSKNGKVRGFRNWLAVIHEKLRRRGIGERPNASITSKVANEQLTKTRRQTFPRWITSLAGGAAGRFPLWRTITPTRDFLLTTAIISWKRIYKTRTPRFAEQVKGVVQD